MATKTTAKDMGLFGDVELESGARQRVTRTKVDVPAPVLQALKDAQSAGKRAVWPVRDLAHYEAMADVFYSAGDLLQASVIPAPVKDTGKTAVDGKKIYEVVKKDGDEWTATHVRVTVGKRRGRKPGETPESTGK